MAPPLRIPASVLTLPVLLFAGVSVSACSRADNPTPLEQSVSTSLVRSDEGRGGVIVEATWVTPSHLNEMPKDVVSTYPPERYVLIHLTLDTHTVDLLTYDLPRLATLQGRASASAVPEAWLALEESGHHRSGVIAFSGASNEQWAAREGVASLTIRQIAGVPDRVFTWEFP